MSKKGKSYTASKIIGVPTAVPKSLKSAITPREDMLEAWKLAMEPKESKQVDDTEDAPF